MAVLTSNAKGAAAQYQADAKNNRQEAPGTGDIVGATGTVVGGDGSTVVAGEIGDGAGITTIPQPGKGFPTGKSASHATGTYPRLTDNTIQQATDTTVSVTTSGGLAISADPNAGSKNALQNFVPCIPAAQGSGNPPAMAASQFPSAGLSQSPNTE